MANKDNWKQQQEREKKVYTHYHLKIRKDDKDVIKKLESVPSKNGYIIDLIRKDIKASKR